MKIQYFLKMKILSFWVFFKKTLQLLNDPKIARINKLLGILIFPFSGFLLFIIKPLFNSQQYQVLSILFALVSLGILFLCVFSPNSLDLLSSFFRSGLNYQLVQFLFSICVKVEIFVNAPYLALRVLWYCFLVVYFFWLFEAIDKSYILFLTFSKALFAIGVIYIRLRMSFFNADALGLAVNQTITFEQSLYFLGKSLTVDSSNAKSISLSSPLCSKLSSRTNHLILPFLIQTRGMVTKAAAEATARTVKEMVSQNKEFFFKGGQTVITGIAGGTGWMLYDNYQNGRKIEAAAELNQCQIQAAAELNQCQIQAAAELNERQINTHCREMLLKERTVLLESVANNNKTHAELSKRWLQDQELKIQLKQQNVFLYDCLQEQKQSTRLLDEKVDTSQFKMGSLEKNTLSEQSFLTRGASENVASGLKHTSVSVSQQTESVLNPHFSTSTTSHLIPSVLDLSKDSIGAEHKLTVAYKMLNFWL